MTTNPQFAAISPQERVLENPRQWALFLDIDGTLIDVAPTPLEVVVPPGLAQLLSTIADGLGGALALVTGRQVASADLLFAPSRFVVSGVHGTELRASPDGEVRMLLPQMPPPLFEAISRAAHAANGILVEHKRSGAAIHYRNNPEAQELLVAGLTAVVADWPGYEVRPGRQVLEIVPRGFSKGAALVAFMHDTPFRGRIPCVIGDDHGDEPALAFARAHGGAGMTVGGEYYARAQADFSGSAAVRMWLDVLAARLAQG